MSHSPSVHPLGGSCGDCDPGVSGSQGRPGAAHARHSAGPYHEGPHTLVALLGVIWGRIRRLWG